jgi:hypothetical protein
MSCGTRPPAPTSSTPQLPHSLGSRAAHDSLHGYATMQTASDRAGHICDPCVDFYHDLPCS